MFSFVSAKLGVPALKGFGQVMVILLDHNIASVNNHK